LSNELRDGAAGGGIGAWYNFVWDKLSGEGGFSNLGVVIDRNELRLDIQDLKKAGKKIVFTNGCFDLLHPGHIKLLEQAKSLGDVLIVGINSDASVRKNKGANRPVMPEGERAEILAGLDAVDYVVVFDEATPRELIAAILPNILVKGSDWGADEIVGREEVERAGGRVVSIPVEPGFSTTNLILRIQRLRA
jgi:D-glycero-beta-D-manno-heptose 1-phosphate adenylyltransferase